MFIGMFGMSGAHRYAIEHKLINITMEEDMKIRNIKYLAIALAGLLGMASMQGPSQAAEAGGVRIPTLSEVLDASGIEISGYIDTSYTYSGNKNVTFTDGTPNRVFDRQPNSFNFNMGELAISMLPEDGFGGAVVLNAGTDADVTAAAGSGSNDNFDVQQAYVRYKQGGIEAMFGKLATLQGAEVIESPDNFNFTRSILFGYAIPFTHTGARISYAINDMITVTGGVNNGWDNLVDDNSQKSGEAMIAFSPSDMLSLTVEGMSGVEAGTTGQGTRNLIDSVLTVTPIEGLTLVVNGDYGTQKKGTATGRVARWWGAAGYINYQINELWRIALRGEYFDDKNGFRTGTTQRWKEGTVTVAFAPTKHVELRGEFRHDQSNIASFLKSNGNKRKTQDTADFEAIYKF